MHLEKTDEKSGKNIFITIHCDNLDFLLMLAKAIP